MLKLYPERVSKYFAKSTLKNWKLEWEEVDGIELVVVVPAISEFENIKKLLLSLSENARSSFKKSLIIFVINSPLSSKIEVKEDNKRSIEFLRALITKDSANQLSKQFITSGIRIGLIDAASEGKELDEEKAGVGLARKIGMDTALRVFDYSLTGKKIIISLDADCLVEENYLSEIQQFFSSKNVNASIVEFKHILPEDDVKKIGILSYEIFLRHYVTGLLFAESPFAFHTIGSTIVCDHEAYIKVGGMNTKKAAEDFYFLQKLMKNYTLHRITSTIVKPSARESWRVPFGTGRSMADFLSNKKEIQVLDPEIYVIVKHWLKILNSDLILNPESVLKETNKIHPELYNFLHGRGFKKEWQRILENTKTTKQLNYQKNNWFDAFETLKLIHHLRDASFPMMDIKTGVEKLYNVIQHSTKFDPTSQINSKLEVLESYLSELIIIENNFYNNIYA